MGEHTVRTSDGRRLRVFDSGDPSGVPLLFHHGTPMSGVPYPPWVEQAKARGVRLISYDRPGYGGSSRHAGRLVADAAADAGQIAHELGVTRLGTFGISGGGPHCLACAARAPELVAAAISLAGVAPFEADGLNWFAGMGADNLAEFGSALAGEETLKGFLTTQAGELSEMRPEQYREMMATLLSGADRAALEGDLLDFVFHNTVAALEHGFDGWIDDDLAFPRPWGFDVGAIRIPVQVRHGDQDRFVPPTHGRWLAERIPHAEARFTPGDGHLTLMGQFDDVVDWLQRHM